jgi:hypothetical protein
MSRRWLTALLFVLAMTFQVVAPVANGVAAAHGLDGLVSGDICLQSAQADHGPQKPGQGRHHHHHHDCALCQGFWDGAAPVASRAAAIVAPAAQWTLLRWGAERSAPTVSLRHVAHQPRAPPFSA